MSEPDPVVVRLELIDPQALALAKMLKRMHYSDARALAVDDRETERMMDAVTRLQRALADVGYSPR